MKKKVNLAEDDLFLLKEGIVYRVVCAPKSWDKEKVQKISNDKFGRPGTSNNEWVITEGDAIPEDNEIGNPVQCADDENRQHWLMNC